jgi:hypothetical protein
MKPGMAEGREGYHFSHAVTVMTAGLSCLGTWVVTHNCLIVFLTVVAMLGSLVILAPGGTIRLNLKGPGFTCKIERKP